MDYIYWSFLLYVLYVLLPIVPAVVIYRLFPKSQAFAQGPLGNMTIKVGGAFGAYVITVGLGWGLVKRIDARIDAMSEPIWRLSATLSLQDSAGSAINTPAGAIDVAVEPPLNGGAYPDLEVRLPLRKPDEWPVVRFKAEGFYDKPVNIRTALERKTATLEEDKRSVKLTEIQVLKQIPKDRPPYPTDEVAATPLGNDGPSIEKSELATEVCSIVPADQVTFARRTSKSAGPSPCVRVKP